MTTRELLVKFQEIAKSGDDAALRAFVEEHRDNKRFISLVDLRSAFLDGFKKELQDRIVRSSEDEEELIEQEMQAYAFEIIGYVSVSAKKRARRLKVALG